MPEVVGYPKLFSQVFFFFFVAFLTIIKRGRKSKFFLFEGRIAGLLHFPTSLMINREYAISTSGLYRLKFGKD